jgi:hypothetical protein
MSFVRGVGFEPTTSLPGDLALKPSRGVMLPLHHSHPYLKISAVKIFSIFLTAIAAY